jgi:hypothetical protein
LGVLGLRILAGVGLTFFDSDGKVTTNFGSFDQALGVAIQPNGRIVAAGFSQPDFALARYLGR